MIYSIPQQDLLVGRFNGKPLQWRHNERDGVSNHRPLDCLFNRLFRGRSKKISKLRVTDLCKRNSQATGEFPARKASNAENVSIWWRHQDMQTYMYSTCHELCTQVTFCSVFLVLVYFAYTSALFQCHCVIGDTKASVPAKQPCRIYLYINVCLNHRVDNS